MRATIEGDQGDIRPGEMQIALPAAFDAGLYFIGQIRTPWTRREECPRRGAADGPVCRLEVDPLFAAALDGLAGAPRLQILYWMDRARRDLVRQTPRRDGLARGTFSIRSPVRPNPIASSIVALVALEPTAVLVRGLDCLDGTPLLDIKPESCAFDAPLGEAAGEAGRT
ncbi:SAM-dependent methyltransferase [Aquabacter spiritensis]|uniref:tRNA-Thr(GGU) m(6)t(6)A37 methyltransferase TsaA n=1 Tax=Aquabacter spiritensis TaxID=933073 RepID=A0A4R3LQA9_9HYPH|nr:SAM-dependent methyltransferase [Aquabacter spiritensis]TCT02683.1 tRNA-Thr(GGU) m(6)t(6)A37 methyltransferase TsaA [Aquabacter spiritensis]